MNTIEGISTPMLKKYVQTRMEVAARANSILNLTYLISLLTYCDRDSIPVNPQVLGLLADQINAGINAIIEELDNFIYILDAEKQLEEAA